MGGFRRSARSALVKLGAADCGTTAAMRGMSPAIAGSNNATE